MINKFKLSHQSIGTFMLILTKGILEQEDITEMFEKLEFTTDDNNEIICLNPPKIDYGKEDDGEFV